MFQADTQSQYFVVRGTEVHVSEAPKRILFLCNIYFYFFLKRMILPRKGGPKIRVPSNGKLFLDILGTKVT